MRKSRLAAVLLTPVVIAGCVASYQEPAQTQKTAMAIFQKAYDLHFSQGGVQGFGISEKDDCTESKKIAVLGELSGDTENSRLPVGHPIIIFAHTTIFQGKIDPASRSGVGLDTSKCRSEFRFVPEEGHTYEIKQNSSMDGVCSLEVTDANSNKRMSTMSISGASACENPDVWK